MSFQEHSSDETSGAAHAGSRPPRPVSGGEPVPPETQAGLTLEQLEQIALEHNPALAQASAEVEAARGNWVQVGLPPNTHIGYTGQQIGSGGLAEQHGAFVAQQFVLGDKLELNRAVACQELQAARQRWAAQRQRILTDVKLGYYDVLISQRRTELTRELVRIAEDSLATAEKLLEARQVSQADVVRSRIALQSTQLQLKTAETMSSAAWKRLAAVLGVPDMLPPMLLGNLESLPEATDEGADLARLIGGSPEMAAALAETQRARWAVHRAQAEPVPNVDVEAIVQHDNGIGGVDGALQVTFPLPWLNRNQGGIRKAQAELIAAERAAGRLALDLQQRHAAVFQQYLSARYQAEDYSRPGGILENARTTLDLVHRAYAAGELPLLDLLSAQRTYSETYLAYLEALGQLWQAKATLDGLLLADSLTAR